MAHKGIIERRNEKSVRGKPFEKGNKKGVAYKILDTSRPIDNDERVKKNDEEIETEASEIQFKLPKNGVNNLNKKIQEIMENIEEKEDKKALELIEKLEFSNGKNTLSIRFSKRHNRMYRIQIFLNDEIEVRPVTYTGASTGCGFWKLLKGALRK
jgi:hypothetical protein